MNQRINKAINTQYLIFIKENTQIKELNLVICKGIYQYKFLPGLANKWSSGFTWVWSDSGVDRVAMIKQPHDQPRTYKPWTTSYTYSFFRSLHLSGFFNPQVWLIFSLQYQDTNIAVLSLVRTLFQLVLCCHFLSGHAVTFMRSFVFNCFFLSWVTTNRDVLLLFFCLLGLKLKCITIYPQVKTNDDLDLKLW